MPVLIEPTKRFAVTLDCINGLGAGLELDTHNPETDLVSRMLHTQRCWEPFESALWLASHSPGCVAVDVGANLGYFSLLSALHESRPGRIIAFEPAADNYRLLLTNVQKNGALERVEAIAAALGNGTATGALYRSVDNLGDHQIYPGDGERRIELIRVLHGADCLEAMGVAHIDLLKVDTQGSEHAVVQGLMPLLQKSRAALRILIELTPWSLRCADSSGASLLALLARLELPVAIVDHLEHRLVPSSYGELSQWSDNVDATPGDRGFMNIFVGEAPEGF